MSMYIAVEGVIGVGKTTLATLAHWDYHAELILEVFEENPFLAPFYSDPDRYAFPVQVNFLLSRYHQQNRVRELLGKKPIVSDYLFAKDRLFAQLNLKGAEWDTYERLHDTLAPHVPAPDVVVFLRATVDTLMNRISKRGREYEQAMPRPYIARLAEVYDHYFATYSATPLLVVDTDDLNFAHSTNDQHHARALIRDALTTARATVAQNHLASR
jgi:deoxyguanosine kinase